MAMRTQQLRRPPDLVRSGFYLRITIQQEGDKPRQGVVASVLAITLSGTFIALPPSAVHRVPSFSMAKRSGACAFYLHFVLTSFFSLGKNSDYRISEQRIHACVGMSVVAVNVEEARIATGNQWRDLDHRHVCGAQGFDNRMK